MNLRRWRSCLGARWADCRSFSHSGVVGLVGTIARADEYRRWLGCVTARSFTPCRRARRALRRLARQGQPIITAHPALESLLAAYELEMFQRERQAYLAPWMPLRTHPLVTQFAAWLKDEKLSPIGKIDRLTINRQEADRSRTAVLGDVARDLDLIRVLARRNQRRLGRGQRNCNKRAKRTQLRRAGFAVDTRITAAVAVGNRAANGGRACRVATARQRRARAVAAADVWRPGRVLPACSRPRETTLSHDDWSYATAAEQFLSAALAREPLSPSWNDAARSIELTDAVERSLKRGAQD